MRRVGPTRRGCERSSWAAAAHPQDANREASVVSGTELATPPAARFQQPRRWHQDEELPMRLRFLQCSCGIVLTFALSNALAQASRPAPAEAAYTVKPGD